MIDIHATLNYIQSINFAFLSEEDNRELNRRVKQIQSKQKDAHLYLAVVGEFSSGKSSFINALLGRRLLKEAVMPTTACATYIECHARLLSLNVSFLDGSQFYASENDFNVLKDYLYCKYTKITSDLLQIITVLTSDQNVAKTVKSLRIRVPGDAIPKNIIIVDTPGFNPGSISVDNHHEITKDVVENIADAAIILTSQEQAMSATLSRFLNTHLKRCLHRCTYVVTKIDILEDNASRDEILRYAKQRIQRDLGINEPRVYGISSVANLPIKRLPLGKEYEWPVLRNQFLSFASHTWNELQKSKEYVISEHVNNLVQDVAGSCIIKLKLKEKKLQSDKAFLEEHRIETIQSVCERMVTESASAIYETMSNISVSFSLSEKKSKEYAIKTINTGSMSLTEFKTRMMPKIKSHVEAEAQKALSVLNSAINAKVCTCVHNQIKKMSDVFTSHYTQFPSLRQTEPAPYVNLIKFKTPNLNFRIAISKIEALDSKEDTAAGGGAAAGAGAGFLIGGPLGALVGAGIGLLFGIGAGDQSQTMRTSVIPLVNNEIASFYSALRIKVDAEISSLKGQYLDLIRSYANQHIKTYGSSVQRLMSSHRQKVDELHVQINSLRNVIFGLQNVQDDIQHELVVLKIK